MSAPEIIFTRQAGVARIQFNRPEALNAVTLSMLDTLDLVLHEIANDQSLSVVILCGSGRSFSAGADLKELKQDPHGIAVSGPGSFPARFNEVLCRLAVCPVPTIAAVRGWALAGGLEIVLCCDLIVASHAARFGDAHAKFGLLPSGGSSARLPRRVGATLAREMMFTGSHYTSAAMHAAGLVSRLVADTDVEAEANSLASQLAERSQSALRRMKSMLLEASEMSIGDALAAEQRHWTEHARSDDMREGLSAFRDRRTPRFTGR